MTKPIEEAVESEEDATLNRVMATMPEEVKDDDLLRLIARFRNERAHFIEAGEKPQRRRSGENGDEE